MKTIYVSMFGPMPANPTGLAMSVLRRAQAFATAGMRTEILIDKFYPDFDQHSADLARSGSLGGSISIRSLFFDLAGQSTPSSVDEYVSPLGGEGWVYTVDNDRPNVSRGRLNGVYKHFVWKRHDAVSVHFIDHLHDEKRTRRDWHDTAGRLCKREIMAVNNRPERIEYFSRQGVIYLIELLDPETQDSLGWKLPTSEDDSLNFSTFEDLYHYWMNVYVLRKSESPTIISEYAFHRTSLQRLERTHQATVIYTFHSNHLGGDHSYGSPSRSEQADFMENLSKFACVVVLTNEQRLDMWKEHGYMSNLEVIPHHLPPVKNVGTRDLRKVVMIGRFDKDKGHEDALIAFKRTLLSVPDATLDFYGRGADEGRLRNLIEEFGLSESVSIKGFTNDSFQVFAESAVSIVASSFEGFCLSLAESMASGCVPVTYDFKYGPRALVNNGVDGLIVEQGNTTDLADAITLVLQQDEYRQELSAAARAITRRLTEKGLIDSWKAVIQAAEAKPKPTSVSSLVSSLSDEGVRDALQEIALAVDEVGTIDVEQLASFVSSRS